MTAAVVLPERRWGPKERPAEVVPVVLVSSLDNAPLPRVAGAVKLGEAARAAGWYVRTGYSRVQVADRFHANGNLAKAAHVLECVGVWLRRPPMERGWAMWHAVDGGTYRFDHAFVGMQRHGWRATAPALSILERVAA